jgi:hypothetical protein
MPFSRGRARRRPWPYDIVITHDDVTSRLLLGALDRDGTNLIAVKPPDQGNVVPTDFGEDARDPVFGRNTTWETLHLGLGQKVEPRGGVLSGRYRYAIGANCSVPWRPAMPGPEILTYSPATTDVSVGVTRFFELGSSLYWTNGRYLKRRDSDSADTVVQDFGGGNAAKDVAVFHTNVGGGARYAYIAMGDSINIYRYDGTTVTQHASLKALAFAVRANDLHRALSVNQVSTVDVNSDPWTAGNWNAANQYYIGEKDSTITRLGVTATGVLLAFKTDGVYTLDTAGEDFQYYPFLKFGKRNDNGEAYGNFLNDIYVRYGETLYKIDPEMVLSEAGPERYGTLDAVMQGYITAFAGHGSFHAYAGLYNVSTGNSYLFQYGAQHIDPETGETQRIETWHGSLSQPFSEKRITALFKSTVGAPANHSRMYLGFSDGTIGWFTLPCVPDPAACDQYRYSTTEGYVILPDWHGGFRRNTKRILSATVSGEDLDAGQYAEVEYGIDGGGHTLLAGAFDITPSETMNLPDDTLAETVSVKLNVATTANDAAPKITTVSLRWRLQVDLQQVYTLLFLAEDHLEARDGTPIRISASRIRDTVKALVSSSSSVSVILPDESEKLMSFIDLKENVNAWSPMRRKWQAAVQVTAIEDASAGTFGTYGRLRDLTYGDVRALANYGALELL